MAGQKNDQILSTTFIITGIIALSKVVGFVREMIVAFYFGQSAEASAYVFAYGIISIFTLLFSAGISSTFIPIYTKTRYGLGEDKTNAFASNLLTLYILLGIVVGALGTVFAEQITALLWRGSQSTVPLMVQMLRQMFPFMAFFAASGVLTNILNARERFIPEQLMGFALSLSTIFACMYVGTIQSVAWATGLSGILQVVILIPFLVGLFRYRPHISFKDQSVRATFLLALPAIISMAFDELNHTIDRIIGSSISDAAVVAMSNSFRLVAFALGVLVVPLTTIMFSRLSRFAAKKDYRSMSDGITQSIELLGFITLPIIAVALVLGQEIIGIAYQRGAFTFANTLYTAPAFSLYMLGVFTFGLRNFLVRVFYAVQDTRTPMRVGIFAVFLNIMFNYLFAVVLKGGIMGLTFATSLSGAVGAITLCFLVTKRFRGIRMRSTVLELCKILICAAAAFFVMLFTRNISLYLDYTFMGNFLRLLGCGLCGALTYLLLVILLRVRSVQVALNLVKR